MNYPTLLIHGYNHNFEEPEHNADNLCYKTWRQYLEDRYAVSFHWYSGRQTLAGRWQAIKEGYFRNTYAYAYERLAPVAAMRLTEQALKIYRNTEVRPDVICHSLGSRVVLQALAKHPKLFRRVIILNGAETVEAGIPIIERSYCDFLNVAVKTDNVLSVMGGLFEPSLGYNGCLGNGVENVPDNMHQVILDDPATQKRYKELFDVQIEGDNPDSIGDHAWSYEWEPNWKIYNAFLNGTL